MELMMMALRTTRIRIMMAILRFPLSFPPWSELLYLQSCLLKYIQLSSVDQWVLPWYGAPPLSHEICASLVRHCSGAAHVSSFVNRQLWSYKSKRRTIKPVLHMFPLWLKWWYRNLSPWASSQSVAHTMLLTQVIRIARKNGGKSL